MTARHAATDGSFGRSAGGAAARGAGLLLIAVVLGFLLLREGGGDPYSRALQTGAQGGPTPTVTLPTATTVTVPLRSPAEIKVLPANGTTTAGAANNTGTKLKAAGYNILAATNTTKAATTSNVYFVPGYEREARVVAQLLGLPDSAAQALPNPSPLADIRDANLVVVVGPDLAKAAPPLTSAPATPTTARRTTATTVRTATTVHTATTAKGATTTTKKP